MAAGPAGWPGCSHCLAAGCWWNGGAICSGQWYCYTCSGKLLWLGPHMVDATPPPELAFGVRFLLPLGVLLAALRREHAQRPEQERSLDFVYSLLLFLLIAFILLGSIAYSLALRTDYFVGLMYTVLLSVRQFSASAGYGGRTPGFAASACCFPATCSISARRSKPGSANWQPWPEPKPRPMISCKWPAKN